MANDQDGMPPRDDNKNELVPTPEEIRDQVHLSYIVNSLPEFGLWNPSIKEAAKIVVVDMCLEFATTSSHMTTCIILPSRVISARLK